MAINVSAKQVARTCEPKLENPHRVNGFHEMQIYIHDTRTDTPPTSYTSPGSNLNPELDSWIGLSQ